MTMQDVVQVLGAILVTSGLIKYLLYKRDRSKINEARVEQVELNKEINKLIQEVKNKELSIEDKKKVYENIRNRVIDINKRTTPRE